MTLNTSERRTIVSNLKWMTFSKIIIYLLSIITITLIPRYLGVDGYGLFNYVLSFVTLFTIIGDLGISTHCLRTISKDTKKTEKYFNGLFFFKLFLITVFFIIVSLISKVVHDNPITKLLITIYSLGVLFSIFSTFSISFYDANQKLKYRALYEIIIKFVYTLGISFVIFFNFKIYGIVISYAIALFVGFLFLVFNLKKIIKFKPKHDKKFVKKTLTYSSPFILTSIFWTIYFSVDKIFISHFLGNYQVGLYSIAYTFIGFLIGLLAILHTSFLPALSKFSNNKKKLSTIIENYLELIYLIALPLLVGGVYLTKKIIVLVFGAQYLEGYLSFSLVMFFFLLNSIGLVNYNLLITNHFEKHSVKLLGFASLINFGLNFLFVPFFGIVGAAITTLIAEMFIFIGSYGLIKKKIIKIDYIRPMIYPLIGSIVMLGFLVVFDCFIINRFILNKFSVLLSIGFGFIIYVSFLFLTKVLTLKKIKKILSKDI